MTFKAWIKTITLYDLLVGMKTTMSHMLHYKPITLQYPHENGYYRTTIAGCWPCCGTRTG